MILIRKILDYGLTCVMVAMGAAALYFAVASIYMLETWAP